MLRGDIRRAVMVACAALLLHAGAAAARRSGLREGSLEPSSADAGLASADGDLVLDAPEVRDVAAKAPVELDDVTAAEAATTRGVYEEWVRAGAARVAAEAAREGRGMLDVPAGPAPALRALPELPALTGGATGAAVAPSMWQASLQAAEERVTQAVLRHEGAVPESVASKQEYVQPHTARVAVAEARLRVAQELVAQLAARRAALLYRVAVLRGEEAPRAGTAEAAFLGTLDRLRAGVEAARAEAARAERHAQALLRVVEMASVAWRSAEALAQHDTVLAAEDDESDAARHAAVARELLAEVEAHRARAEDANAASRRAHEELGAAQERVRQFELVRAAAVAHALAELQELERELPHARAELEALQAAARQWEERALAQQEQRLVAENADLHEQLQTMGARLEDEERLADRAEALARENARLREELDRLHGAREQLARLRADVRRRRMLEDARNAALAELRAARAQLAAFELRVEARRALSSQQRLAMHLADADAPSAEASGLERAEIEARERRVREQLEHISQALTALDRGEHVPSSLLRAAARARRAEVDALATRESAAVLRRETRRYQHYLRQRLMGDHGAQAPPELARVHAAQRDAEAARREQEREEQAQKQQMRLAQVMEPAATTAAATEVTPEVTPEQAAELMYATPAATGDTAGAELASDADAQAELAAAEAAEPPAPEQEQAQGAAAATGQAAGEDAAAAPADIVPPVADAAVQDELELAQAQADNGGAMGATGSAAAQQSEEEADVAGAELASDATQQAALDAAQSASDAPAVPTVAPTPTGAFEPPAIDYVPFPDADAPEAAAAAAATGATGAEAAHEPAAEEPEQAAAATGAATAAAPEPEVEPEPEPEVEVAHATGAAAATAAAAEPEAEPEPEVETEPEPEPAAATASAEPVHPQPARKQRRAAAPTLAPPPAPAACGQPQADSLGCVHPAPEGGIVGQVVAATGPEVAEEHELRGRAPDGSFRAATEDPSVSPFARYRVPQRKGWVVVTTNVPGEAPGAGRAPEPVDPAALPALGTGMQASEESLRDPAERLVDELRGFEPEIVASLGAHAAKAALRGAPSPA